MAIAFIKDQIDSMPPIENHLISPMSSATKTKIVALAGVLLVASAVCPPISIIGGCILGLLALISTTYAILRIKYSMTPEEYLDYTLSKYTDAVNTRINKNSFENAVNCERAKESFQKACHLFFNNQPDDAIKSKLDELARQDRTSFSLVHNAKSPYHIALSAHFSNLQDDQSELNTAYTAYSTAQRASDSPDYTQALHEHETAMNQIQDNENIPILAFENYVRTKKDTPKNNAYLEAAGTYQEALRKTFSDHKIEYMLDTLDDLRQKPREAVVTLRQDTQQLTQAAHYLNHLYFSNSETLTRPARVSGETLLSQDSALRGYICMRNFYLQQGIDIASTPLPL